MDGRHHSFYIFLIMDNIENCEICIKIDQLILLRDKIIRAINDAVTNKIIKLNLSEATPTLEQSPLDLTKKDSDN